MRSLLPTFSVPSAPLRAAISAGPRPDFRSTTRYLRSRLALLAGLLALPGGLAAAQVDLTWQDNSSTETGFQIERATGAGAYSVLTTTAANVTSYTDTTVAESTTYSYRVAAVASTQTSAYSNIATVTTPSTTPTNTAPTISNIANRTINEDANTGAVAFTIGDAESVASSLTVSGSSSNTTLVPNAAITFGGSGASRTVTVTPAANQNGSAIITVTVSDGDLSATDTFTLAVTAVNDPPTISNITNQTINQDTSTTALAFTIADVETAAGSLTVSGSSSNTTLVPNSGIVFVGSGANRTVTVTPAVGQSGSATITVTVSDGSASDSDTFTLTVNAVAPANTAPTISNITNRTINEDANTGEVAFTIGDAESAASNLTVSGSSSNTTVVPNSGITFGGTGADRTVTVTPAANQNGSAVITVTVSDGELSASDTFTLTVTAVNDAPTISSIANQAINEDTSTGALAFAISDVETAAGSLSVSGSSSNTTLVPNSAITFGGSGANRTVTITPAANQNGPATITVTVSDGSLAASTTFTLSVTAVNDTPTISDITDQAINQDTDTGVLAFTIGDVETTSSSLTVSGSSSNPMLVPNSGITFGGSGANRTVTVTPAAGQSGSATITVTVSDGSASASDTFTLAVNAVAPANTAPTIANITNRTINEDADTGAVAFTIGDAESAASSLTVSGSSSNTTVVPDSGIVFGGSGANRTVTVTPAANQNGSAVITVTVSDGELSATDSFALTVTAVNDAPTISNIANQTINEDASTSALAFTIADVETAASNLYVSGSSSNTTLVPNSGITFGGSGVNRTVTVTPAANQNGSATITVTVSDGELSATDSFTVTVTAVNDAPTISDIANQAIDQDTDTGALAFTIADVETAAASLSVSGSSSNTTLVPNSAIVFGGSGGNRTVTVTPASGQSGAATVTVTVSDGSASASATFTLTVNAVTPANTAPTISNIVDQAITVNANTGAIAFTISDAETSPGSLSVSAVSSNNALVPASAIVLGGSGANRTITVTPAPNQGGTATLSLTVTDGDLSTSTTFVLTVDGGGFVAALPADGFISTSLTSSVTGAFTATFDATPSVAPVDAVIGLSPTTASAYSDLGIIARFNTSGTIDARNGANYAAANAIPYTAGTTYHFRIVGDFATHTSTTYVTPEGGSEILLGTDYAFRTEQSAATAFASWSVAIDSTLADAALTVGNVTVTTNTPTNTAPTISNIFSRTITEDGTTGAIAFTVGDAESSAQNLVVTASSSNVTLVPAGNLTLGGSGGTRSLTIVPAANQSGVATITVTVSDGELSASDTFQLTVSAVNDAPTISTFTNRTIPQDTSTGAVSFTVADIESAAGTLTVSGSSSNAILVPASGIAFGGSGANRIVTVTPAAGQSGSTTITVVVSDGAATATASFVLTVTPVAPANTPPTITSIPNQSGNADGSIGPVTFTIADSESSAASLSVSATSSNPTLVPTANIVLSGSGASRSLMITPAPGQIGTATITVTVSDGTNSTTSTFTVSIATAALPQSRMLNLSTRVLCRPGSDSLIPGFVISGTENKRVLLRAVGPTLGADPYNVPNTLPNPRLVLKRWNGSAFEDLASNDDWGLNANAAEIRTTSDAVSAFPLAEGSADAALLLDLAPGQYTVFVDDPTGAEGVVIVELYDTDPTATGTNLINMSNRGFVGAGAEVMISGFVVSAEAPKTLLIRAVGPGLAVAPYNVPNTLSDPAIQIFRRETDGTDTLVLTQDNWSDGPLASEVAQVAQQVSAFPLPAGSKDAAIVTTLDPGVYTVVVSGVNGAMGTALVEVYTVE